MSASELINKNARTIVDMLRRSEVCPHDLLDALEQRIAAVDGPVNALPTLCFDRARAHADRLTKLPMERRGLLAGMPIPIKDLSDVEGVLTTQGSLIFAKNVAKKSNILVERLEENGGVVYAKSNTPEFGAGANTFNEVFGATRNPWNTARSAAGSSGGAAVALATGTAWLAHGSDLGGSLRNPASFCGIVGMRPSIGRVAHSALSQVDGTLGVDGPMARNVEDLALLFDAMAGEHPGDPLSLPAVEGQFLKAAQSGSRPRKVAYSADLGITPVDPEIAAITRAAAEKLAGEGVIVEEAHPDLSEAHECFQTLRALAFATARAKLLREHRELLKPEVVWNIEQGLALSVDEIVKAQGQRVTLMNRMRTFFETYDLLLCPATIVAAFPIEERYLKRCNGVEFKTYVDWLAIAYAATLACCPALSLPCGSTHEGLPVGLQVIAGPRADGRVLAGSKFAEDVLGLGAITPIVPRAPAVPHRAAS